MSQKQLFGVGRSFYKQSLDKSSKNSKNYGQFCVARKDRLGRWNKLTKMWNNSGLFRSTRCNLFESFLVERLVLWRMRYPLGYLYLLAGYSSSATAIRIRFGSVRFIPFVGFIFFLFAFFPTDPASIFACPILARANTILSFNSFNTFHFYFNF